MIKAVLFDLDGVLLDTEGVYTDFWSNIDRLYPTGVENFAYVIKGNTLTNIFNTYFPDADIREKVKKMLVEQETNMPYRLFDGALELIDDLRARGMKTAIVTSSNSAKMRNVFEQLPRLRDAIDLLITDEDVSHSKPHPEGYLKAAAAFGLSGDECIVVEDSMAGLEAGRRAGAVVAGIASTNPMNMVAPASDIAVNAIGDLTADMLLKHA